MRNYCFGINLIFVTVLILAEMVLCDCWHPPECQFYKSGTGCKFGAECPLPHWKGETQRPKKDGDKSAVATVKSERQLGCVSQDAEPPESVAISRKDTKVLGFTRAALRESQVLVTAVPAL